MADEATRKETSRSDDLFSINLAVGSLGEIELTGGSVTSSRVGQGSHRPRPPTDPDVRHSRIRLLRSRIRCRAVPGPDDDGCRHRIPLQKPVERLPVQPMAL